MSLLDLFSRGGILMYPILICSLAAIAVIIERIIVLRRANTDAGQFMLKLRSVLQRNDLMAAVNFCSKTNTPLANMLKKGLTKYPEGHERVREAIENAGKEETFTLEERLGILASVAGIAPLLGFLGTVTGMISAFRTIETLASAVNPSDLAGGIWEALITTAFGLTVGVLAFGFYNYFVTRVNRLVFDLERSSEEFIDLVRSGKLDVSEQDHQLSKKAAPTEEVYFKKKA